MTAPDEVVERAEQYGDEITPGSDTARAVRDVLRDHYPDWWRCSCGFPSGALWIKTWAGHAAAELAAAGLLADLDDRPADAPAPRLARRVGSFAASGGPRRLADEEG